MKASACLFYDDATGEALRPCVTLKGHPTIGVGRALDTHGVTPAEAYSLLTNDLNQIERELNGKIQGFSQLAN